MATVSEDAGQEMATQTLTVQEYAVKRPGSVDRQSCVIRGAKVLGLSSSNGRDYEPAALDGAVGLYEGARVYVDHSNDSRRSLRDKIGKLSSAERRSDGIYADIQLNPKHDLTESVLWDAENSPDSFGLSQVAEARVKRAGQREIVESILRVRSVDLVSCPATTKGLFEMDGLESDPQDMTWGLFCAKAEEVYSGPGDAQSKANKIQALALALLKLGDAADVAASNTTEGQDVGEDQKKPTETEPVADSQPESTTNDTVLEQSLELDRERRLSAAYRVLAECRVVPDAVRVKALSALDTDDERKSLCESWLPVNQGIHPRTGQRQQSAKTAVSEGMTTREYLRSRK